MFSATKVSEQDVSRTMGKTRMEELFYELYASSKRHDSWQRYAMVRELRDLMKQPKGSRSDRSDDDEERSDDGDEQRFGAGQFGEGADDDEELGETEVATDSIETEHETVNLVPEAPEEESIPQVQVPIDNSEITRSIEPEKVDLGLEKEELGLLNENLEQEWDQKNDNKEIEADGDIERDQKMIRDAKICCAHKVFCKMPSKEKRIKHLKGWKFKFKRKSLVGIMLQIEQCKLRERRRRMYNKLSTNIKDESMKERIVGNHPRMVRQLHKSRVQCKMRMRNDSWGMRRLTLKIMKSHRKHKWKFKHLQIASNFWINHSHKLADLILRTALTEQDMSLARVDWRTMNSTPFVMQSIMVQEMVPMQDNETVTKTYLGQAHELQDTTAVGVTSTKQELSHWFKSWSRSIVKLLFQNSLVHHQQTVNADDERHIMVCVDKSDGQWFWMVFVRKPADPEPAISTNQESAIFQPDNAQGMVARGKDGFVKPNPRYILLADQRIWEKETHAVDITDAYSVLQEELEQVVNHTPFSVIKLERPQDHDALLLLLSGDERFQIKHKWRFKLLELKLYMDSFVLITSYAHQFDIISLIILMSVELFTDLSLEMEYLIVVALQRISLSSLQTLRSRFLQRREI